MTSYGLEYRDRSIVHWSHSDSIIEHALSFSSPIFHLLWYHHLSSTCITTKERVLAREHITTVTLDVSRACGGMQMQLLCIKWIRSVLSQTNSIYLLESCVSVLLSSLLILLSCVCLGPCILYDSMPDSMPDCWLSLMHTYYFIRSIKIQRIHSSLSLDIPIC